MKSRNSLSIIVGLLAMLVVISGSAEADENNSNAGTRVFNFLKIPVGARPMAMGGAFTGVADDEASLYYNPAGIARLEGKRFLAGYHNNIFDMQSGVLGYMHPLGEGKKVAVYINYLNYGEFIRTDDNGFEQGTFSGSDILFAGGYAMAVNEQLSVGGTAKLIYEKVDTYSSTGFAVDLGGRLSVNEGITNFGLMIQNLGAQLSTFVDGGEKDPLPLYFRAGASTYPRGLPLLLALDLIMPTDNDLYFALGGEFLSLRPLYLRAGWTNFGSNFKTGAGSDDIAGFSVGFGLEHRNMQISYTISPEAELGTSHRVTFTGGF
ncbi:MAG: PorV/PorQ family protein [Candidatus Zixiibacteriota bacterium]|nr:MAG: PorV/PorQ family protein [candidate division Zixibacteria bacterium]